MSGEAPEQAPHRRTSDSGLMCRIAIRASQFWDFIDRRQIDAHVVNAITMYGTVDIFIWAKHFAEHGDRPGLEVAAIIGAVAAPWSLLQSAMIKFIFDARRGSFDGSSPRP